MSKITIFIVGALLVLGMIGCNGYNGMVTGNNEVEKLWSNVQTQYQRRNDLIGNLVKTVQGAADYEKSTLTAVIEARASATKATINVKDLTPENMAKFQAAQDQLSGSLSRLLVSVEQYPNLKANENFMNLQAEIAGTENRISVARQTFNDGIEKFNNLVQKFPNNIMAGIFGFARKASFSASEKAQTAPEVNFDFKK